jgi:hypothetical protein
MTTRAELRAALRQRLDDASPSPLWDNPVLDEALAGAIRAYGLRFPRQAAVAVTILAGATEVAVPAVTADPGRIVRLLDPRGRVVPGAADDPAAGLVAQSWRWWAGSLRLSQPALGGDWRLEYLAPRQVPTDDVSAVDVVDGDEELVVVLALASALGQRAADDAKRGARSEMRTLADAARTEAANLYRARQRRVRGGWLGTA